MSIDAVSTQREVPLATEQKSSLPENKCDRAADQQILDCLSSKEPLTNCVIQYSYDKQPYSLRVIHNPQKKTLMIGKEQFDFQGGLISSQPLPAELKNHLESLFQKKGCKLDFCINVSIESGGFDFFDSMTLASDTPPTVPIKTAAEQPKAETAPTKQPEVAPAKPAPQAPKANETKAAEQPKTETAATKQPEVASAKPAPQAPKTDETKAAEQPKTETAATKQPEVAPAKPVSEAPKFDEATDEKIKAVLNSKTFTKQTFDYPFGDVTYKIFVFHNPQSLPLWSEGTENIITTRVWLQWTDSIPMSLEIHLTKLVLKQETTQDLQTDPIARSPKDVTFKHAATLEPVVVSPKDKLDIFDGEIRKCFSSKELVNRVFIYQIKDQIVKARIIHNPSGEPFQRTIPVGSDKKTYSWNYKYGTLLDKECPELLSHLQTIIDLPLLDIVWNFKRSNGTKLGLTTNSQRNLTEFDVYGPQDSITGA